MYEHNEKAIKRSRAQAAIAETIYLKLKKRNSQPKIRLSLKLDSLKIMAYSQVIAISPCP